MKTRLMIGLMSGTSVDAIDAALVVVSRRGEQYGAKVVGHVEHRWPKKLRERLLAVMAPAETSTAEICELNFLVAREFAAAVEKLLRHAEVAAKSVAAVASHGQTVCHLPPQSKIKNQKSKIGSTLQLGDPSVIATLTGMMTVGNFRPADMAVGGQGAPLVPWTDDVLFAHATKTRCVQNIGGIGNVTYVPSLRTHPQTWTFYTPKSVNTESFEVREPVIAFDTGPGNMVMDAVVSMATGGRQRFDRGGRLAGKGAVDVRLFRELQAHPYFSRRPPKSTGREEFGVAFASRVMAMAKRKQLSLEVVVHTLARLTAWSIADAYLHFLPRLPEEIILCGGGADNPVLVRMLGEEFAGLRSEFVKQAPPEIRRIDAFGIPNKAKEAASFAILGAATLDGVAGNLPSVTGARRPVVLGVVARPG
ncbi:MAG TPA: anhydro-N-acetylmuramic acid kinase [Phycisphaerae bacterium]|nr:anhydro-N-acetylmuramic acid kinase [Phycisphaerae bacterium]